MMLWRARPKLAVAVGAPHAPCALSAPGLTRYRRLTPVSAALADRFGRRPVLLASAILAALVGLTMPALLARGLGGVLAFLSLALGVMGLTFAPLGALLPELFPTEVRYTGAASAYNLGGILGASLAPSLAQILEANGGVAWVGDYIAAAAAISFLAILSMRETRHDRVET